MALEIDVLVKASPMRSLRGLMDDELTPEARARVLRKATAEFPAQANFLTDRHPLVSERVPVVLVNRLTELTAEELNQPAVAFAHRFGRRSADEASRGVLRLAMVLVSMENLLRKLVPTWTQMYSHGTMTSQTEGRSITINLADFPVQSAVGCARVTGTLEWFAQKAEKSATVGHVLCRAKHGGDVCRWVVRW